MNKRRVVQRNKKHAASLIAKPKKIVKNKKDSVEMRDNRKGGKALNKKRAKEDMSDVEEDSDFETVAITETKKQRFNDSEVEEENEGNENCSSDDDAFIAKANLKARRKSASAGSFQSLGLSSSVLKAITRKGFKLPTPIQRRCLPVLLEGRDVVGMARTGSGKTAAFVIPMIEKLKMHSAKMGARALILSSSRELAVQTLKFTKEMAKLTDLRTCLLVGGDKLEDQFTMMASNPDILIATPGRLMHLMVEMELDLRSIEYVCFDEADRLFEMGFATQLHEILHKLPESRQTALFSATLPKSLVEFAKAGLNHPQLIRLDADSKISSDLENVFLFTSSDAKDSALLLLLQRVVPQEEQCLVFMATKHHVEYMMTLLSHAQVDAVAIHGGMDHVARLMALSRFKQRQTRVLVVTDVAARGIDVPLLDNVINYDFPAQAKLFVHRVGRVARAGRAGRAYSLVSQDEMPYLLDLQLFLARRLLVVPVQGSAALPADADLKRDVILGSVPQTLLDTWRESILAMHGKSVDLVNQRRVMDNAYQLYRKTRSIASKESYSRTKQILDGGQVTQTLGQVNAVNVSGQLEQNSEVMSTAGDMAAAAVTLAARDGLGCHPCVRSLCDEGEEERALFMASIRQFRPSETIFEATKKSLKDVGNALMQSRRKLVDGSIVARREAKQKAQSAAEEAVLFKTLPSTQVTEMATESDLAALSKPKPKALPTNTGKLQATGAYRDPEYYMSYTAKDAATDRGYALDTGFVQAAASAELDLGASKGGIDDMNALKSRLLWDRKKKRFTRATIGSDNKKRIRTESGALIDASYKKNIFSDWQKKNQVTLPRAGEEELDERTRRALRGMQAPSSGKNGDDATVHSIHASSRFKHRAKLADPHSKRSQKLGKSVMKSPTQAKNELRSPHEIQKQRMEKQKRMEKNARPSKKKHVR